MGRNRQERLAIEPSKLERIIVAGESKLLVAESEKLGESLANLSSSQIRAIFTTVRQIEYRWQQEGAELAERDLILLKPKMQYRASKNSEMKILAPILSHAIDLVVEVDQPEVKKKRFGYFLDFFEAVLAYQNSAALSKKGR